MGIHGKLLQTKADLVSDGGLAGGGRLQPRVERLCRASSAAGETRACAGRTVKPNERPHASKRGGSISPAAGVIHPTGPMGDMGDSQRETRSELF